MMIKNSQILVIGGSGFIGSHVCHLLSAAGARVSVPTRRRDRAKHLILLPTVDVVEADVHDPATLATLMVGKGAVISLVGVLHSASGTPFGRGFARAHVDLPRQIVAACKAAGVRRLIHVSALGASPDAPSQYLRSKAAGEAVVRESGLDWTLLRPSLVFGEGRNILSLFADLQRSLPCLPLAGADSRYQPVYANDVARTVLRALESPDAVGATYPLCGPRVYTLAQIARRVGQTTGHARCIIGVPGLLAWFQALAMECMPGPTLMSRDNLRSMKVDNVCPDGCTLPFDLVPTRLESVIDNCVALPGPRARYDSFRGRAHR